MAPTNRKAMMTYLVPEDYERLSKIADHIGVSMSAVVTMLIREKARSLFPESSK